MGQADGAPCPYSIRGVPRVDGLPSRRGPIRVGCLLNPLNNGLININSLININYFII
jgi:hypothetical protein